MFPFKKFVWLLAILLAVSILIYTLFIRNLIEMPVDEIGQHYFPPEFGQSDSVMFPVAKILVSECRLKDLSLHTNSTKKVEKNGTKSRELDNEFILLTLNEVRRCLPMYKKLSTNKIDLILHKAYNETKSLGDP